MASHIGIVNLFSLTAPTGAVIERTEQVTATKAVKLQGTNVAGKVVTVKGVTENYCTITVRMSGKGAVDFTVITPGNITVGTLKIISAQQDESNKEFPGFELEAITYGAVVNGGS